MCKKKRHKLIKKQTKIKIVNKCPILLGFC